MASFEVWIFSVQRRILQTGMEILRFALRNRAVVPHHQAVRCTLALQQACVELCACLLRDPQLRILLYNSCVALFSLYLCMMD